MTETLFNVKNICRNSLILRRSPYMMHSSFDQNIQKTRPDLTLIKGHGSSGIIPDPTKYPPAAGGFRTTAMDYAKFMQAIMDAYNTKNPIFQEMFVPPTSAGYGLGIGVCKIKNSSQQEVTLLQHNGMVDGFKTRMEIVPELKLAFLTFVNNQLVGDNVSEAVFHTAVEKFNEQGERWPTPLAEILSKDIGAEYLGEYELKDSGNGKSITVKILKMKGNYSPGLFSEPDKYFLEAPRPFPFGDTTIRIPLYNVNCGALKNGVRLMATHAFDTDIKYDGSPAAITLRSPAKLMITKDTPKDNFKIEIWMGCGHATGEKKPEMSTTLEAPHCTDISVPK